MSEYFLYCEKVSWWTFETLFTLVYLDSLI